MDHVIIRDLEHLAGSYRAPKLGYAIEMRERPGPAHKTGAFPNDVVWIQLKGGLMVARARVELGWVGEYSSIAEIRRRTKGSPLFDMTTFWKGRPKYGYAAVAELRQEAWLDPYWAGPRSYGYEWVLIDNDKKRATWLERKDPPRGGEDLRDRFLNAYR
jgi:hypothetical protein